MLKKVLLILVLCITILTGNTARADIDKWLPDSDNWFGKQLKKAVDLMAGKIKDFTGFLVEGFKKAIQVVADTIKLIWDTLRVVLDGFIETVSKIWEWLKDSVEGWYVWAGDMVTEFWDLLGKAIEKFQDWILEWVWYFIEYNIELGYSYMDWCVGTGKTIFEKVLDFLPAIELPEGFEQGLQYFMAYGLILDKFLPLTELFYLINLYLTIFLALIIHNHVKGWWRWIGWFNK